MTTLDDAAERRITELASSCARSDAAVENLIRTAWIEATEVAAKKCETRREALRELVLCARKLRHSAETGTERKNNLKRIDAAIKAAAALE